MPGSPNQALAALPADARVRKVACDSFAGTNLDAILRASASDTVLICGFATEFCVDTTVRTAASRGLHVIALSDAHTTSNRPHLQAGAIVAHHNWIWTNMDCPRGASLTVQTTEQAFPA